MVEGFSEPRDIVAERITEHVPWRARIRDLIWKRGRVFSQAARGKGEIESKFSDYYDFSEPVSRILPHRVLAIWKRFASSRATCGSS